MYSHSLTFVAVLLVGVERDVHHTNCLSPKELVTSCAAAEGVPPLWSFVPQALNEHCAQLFEEGSLREAFEALQLMTHTLLPHLLPLLSPQASPRDVRAVEEVRNRWCAMLGMTMPGEKQEKLQDMLSKLLDPGADTLTTSPLSIPRVTNLSAAYEQAMRRLTSSKHFEASLEEGVTS